MKLFRSPGAKKRRAFETPRWAARGVLTLALAVPLLGLPERPGQRFKDEVFNEARATKDILYQARPNVGRDGKGLRLDLYEPGGDTLAARPLMLWIHGGGFYRGGKAEEWMVKLAEHFARCGFICASIDYRLVLTGPADWLKPENLRKACATGVEDAQAALCFLAGQAGRYRIDTTRVILGGGSAGAFIALQTTTGREAERCGMRIGAVIDFWGGLLDASLLKPGFPPLLIIHGTQDRTVSFERAKRLAARAAETGVICVLRPIEDEGHAPWEHLKAYLVWVHDFLSRIPLDGRS